MSLALSYIFSKAIVAIAIAWYFDGEKQHEYARGALDMGLEWQKSLNEHLIENYALKKKLSSFDRKRGNNGRFVGRK